MDNNVIKYYTVDDSKRKFKSLAKVEEAYKDSCETEIEIIEHIEKRFKHKINQNIYGITIEEKREFVLNILSQLLKKTESIIDYSGTAPFIEKEDFFMWVIKRWVISSMEHVTDVIDTNSIGNIFSQKYKYRIKEILIKFIKNIIDRYPLEDTEILRLSTDYKPCNGIIIVFTKLDKIFLDAVIREKHILYDKVITENPFRGIAFTIQFRTNDIAFTTGRDAHGRNVHTRKRSQVDIKSQKVIEHIESSIANLK